MISDKGVVGQPAAKAVAMRKIFVSIPAIAAIALLAACAKKEEPAAPTTTVEEPIASAKPPMPAFDYRAIAQGAVDNPARPDADREADANRRPVETLTFMQISPGMTVFEVEAGAGWYTELLSHAVGAGGAVIMQNPQGFRDFVGAQIDARLENNRLANVRQSLSTFDALDAADASVDLVTWVQGPHELYFTPSEGESLGDPARSFLEIKRILKASGAFVVIDHSALAGAPQDTGNTLHRIDQAIVIQMAEAAGFRLAAESDMLSNSADSRTITVFDPSIRGRTDQFALRFVKD
jgi:predicted methyltransferase